MSELSQAERPAMNEAMRVGVKSGTLGETVWLAARDYGREREQALREALDGLLEAAKPYLDKAAPHENLFDGEDLRNFGVLSGAVLLATSVLAASPGEPEGRCSWCEGKRVLMGPDGSKLQPCSYCQPDHGPIRFEISNSDQSGYKVSIPNLLPNQDDRLAVREDRATEADIEAVARALYGGNPWWEEQPNVHARFRNDARRLLGLIFGEEASRV